MAQRTTLLFLVVYRLLLLTAILSLFHRQRFARSAVFVSPSPSFSLSAFISVFLFCLQARAHLALQPTQ